MTLPPCVATARLDRLLLQPPLSAVAVLLGIRLRTNQDRVKHAQLDTTLRLLRQYAWVVVLVSFLLMTLPLQLPLAQTVMPARSVRPQVHLCVRHAQLDTMLRLLLRQYVISVKLELLIQTSAP